MNQGGANPLQDARAFVAELMMHLGTIQQMLEENAQLKERVAALEAENAALTETTGKEIKIYSHTPVMLEEVSFELAQGTVNDNSQQGGGD